MPARGMLGGSLDGLEVPIGSHSKVSGCKGQNGIRKMLVFKMCSFDKNPLEFMIYARFDQNHGGTFI